jgi:hypothetical protein
MEGIMIVDKTLKLGDLKLPPLFYDYYLTPGDDTLVVTTTDARFGNQVFAQSEIITGFAMKGSAYPRPVGAGRGSGPRPSTGRR